MKKINTIHGLSGHPLYKIHNSIKCRGLLCDDWALFTNFYDDLISSYKEGYMLYRINCKDLYRPSNVYWKEKLVRRNRLSQEDTSLITSIISVVDSTNDKGLIDANKDVITDLLDIVIGKLKGV